MSNHPRALSARRPTSPSASRRSAPSSTSTLLPSRTGTSTCWRPIPDWQRQGLGAAIIAPTAELCRQTGIPLYLETESVENVGYYSHVGFRVRSEWDVPLDGPHMWGMIRDP
jgi:hypothetical protein